MGGQGSPGQRLNPLEWRGYPLGLALSARGQSPVAQELKLPDFLCLKKPVLGIRIRDPGSGVFLTPGSVMGKKSGSGIRIRAKHPGSYFREHSNIFLG
jgi:hypothetical protein